MQSIQKDRFNISESKCKNLESTLSDSALIKRGHQWCCQRKWESAESVGGSMSDVGRYPLHGRLKSQCLLGERGE